jgi:hypothetical protein
MLGNDRRPRNQPLKACTPGGGRYCFYVLTTADLKGLTKIEKLRLMEALWSDFSDQDSCINSPSWHHEELKDSKRLHGEGRASFSDWGEAKERIQAAVNRR